MVPNCATHLIYKTQYLTISYNIPNILKTFIVHIVMMQLEWSGFWTVQFECKPCDYALLNLYLMKFWFSKLPEWESSIFWPSAVDSQRRILDPFKHLWWKTYFRKNFHRRCLTGSWIRFWLRSIVSTRKNYKTTCKILCYSSALH